MEYIENIRSFLDLRIRRMFVPLTRLLNRIRVTPNQITVAGFLLNLVAAGFLAKGMLVIAGAVFVVAGLFDMLDGSLARLSRMVTPFGAFFDSTLDRVAEGVILAAVAYRFAVQGWELGVVVVVLALLGSMLVSYTRARAEGLGLECKVGLMSRPERIILIAIGLFFNVLLYAMCILLALTALTVVQRMAHTYRQLDTL